MRLDEPHIEGIHQGIVDDIKRKRDIAKETTDAHGCGICRFLLDAPIHTTSKAATPRAIRRVAHSGVLVLANVIYLNG